MSNVSVVPSGAQIFKPIFYFLVVGTMAENNRGYRASFKTHIYISYSYFKFQSGPYCLKLTSV